MSFYFYNARGQAFFDEAQARNSGTIYCFSCHLRHTCEQKKKSESEPPPWAKGYTVIIPRSKEGLEV